VVPVDDHGAGLGHRLDIDDFDVSEQDVGRVFGDGLADVVGVHNRANYIIRGFLGVTTL
jgi:hypothetical protein